MNCDSRGGADQALWFLPSVASLGSAALLQLHFGLLYFDPKALNLKILPSDLPKLSRQGPLDIIVGLNSPNHGASRSSCLLD